MLRHKNINYICWAAAVLSVFLVFVFAALASAGRISGRTSLGYENRLFDTSKVHRIDIVMDDWETFLASAESEEYSPCTLVIDGEACANVGIRGKGNTSLSQVASYGNDRYSFKVEFDKYNTGGNYYGLDKLSLNNLISDNTYLKDYLCYQMMQAAGAVSSLCSFAWITVNGEDWGLYLAVEGVEDAFLQRNYGSDHGNLYKPDSTDFGGGRGNGAGFQMEDIGGQGQERSIGSSDVRLQYTDDDPDSYPNIFGNAKTAVTQADKERLIASLKQLSEGENVEEIVDIEAVIRYLAVHNFVCNDDSYTGTIVHNYYLYEEDGVLSMLPWDYNLAFGGMGMGGGGRNGNGNGKGMAADEDTATAEVNQPIDSPVTDGTLESRPMISWIFENEEYTALYHQYYAEFIETYFDSGYFEQMIEETVALISPFVEKDPTAFCTYEEFQTGTKTLQEFCLLRARSVSGQLAGTIPSTQEGQREAGASLIDASHISLSDMGAFSGGGPGGGLEGGPGKGMEEGDGLEGGPGRGMEEGGGLEGGPGRGVEERGGLEGGPGRGVEEGGGLEGGPGRGMEEGGGFEGGFRPDGQEASASGSWMLLGGVILVLLAGICAAWKWRRR